LTVAALRRAVCRRHAATYPHARPANRGDRPAHGEDWLLKVQTDGVIVDLLLRAAGKPVTAELLARSDVLEVLPVRMPVMYATDIVSHKLQALTEHYCDFALLLAVVRAVREQIDWPRLRAEAGEHDSAAAFLFLADRLGISLDPGGGASR
jgi:hypothetical protein